MEHFSRYALIAQKWLNTALTCCKQLQVIVLVCSFVGAECGLNGVLRSSHQPLDSLRMFSESPSIVGLFGARRLSQQSNSFSPEPQKGTYPYDVRRYRTSVDYFGTLRRTQTTRQLYSPECVEGEFSEVRLQSVAYGPCPSSHVLYPSALRPGPRTTC